MRQAAILIVGIMMGGLGSWAIHGVNTEAAEEDGPWKDWQPVAAVEAQSPYFQFCLLQQMRGQSEIMLPNAYDLCRISEAAAIQRDREAATAAKASVSHQ